jgi:hypothetical protein
LISEKNLLKILKKKLLEPIAQEESVRTITPLAALVTPAAQKTIAVESILAIGSLIQFHFNSQFLKLLSMITMLSVPMPSKNSQAKKIGTC